MAATNTKKPIHDHQPKVIIIGGGFAGVEVAKKLQNKAVQVLLLDRNNYFTFQPLIYQVATGGLEPNSVAYPLRRLFQSSRNISFRVADVRGVYPEKQQIDTSLGPIDYDYLVIASGSRPVFFGLDEQQLLPLKSVPEALDMRNWILQKFESALVTREESQKDAMFNFVIVGGGPTGVELAGALAEMKRFVLPKDYPELDIDRVQIHLLEGADRLLPAMSETASGKAQEYLEDMGVRIHLKELVSEYDGQYVEIAGEQLPADHLIWTAGVGSNPPEFSQAKVFSPKNRLVVDPYHRVKEVNNVFAVGDVAQMSTPEYPDGHPMLAPVAIQQGKHLGKNLLRRLNGKPMEAFRFKNNGVMATVGRNKAVADLPKMKIWGFPAWFAWMLIHLLFLVGFRNKLVVLINWIYSYFTYDKALRLIIRKPKQPRSRKVEPLEQGSS